MHIFTKFFFFFSKDDFGDSDIEDSKVLGDIAEKEVNDVGNGIIHKEEATQVHILLILLYPLKKCY